METIENLDMIINRLPNKERKEFLENSQMMFIIATQLNYLIRYNLRMNFQTNTRIDNLIYELNEKNGQHPLLENPQKINETVEKYEEHEPVIKWIKRKYEEEAKNLEGKQQNE